MSLYATHVPTSSSQKVLLTIGAATGALMKPARADLVAVLGETTGNLAFRRMRDNMAMDPVGQTLLRDRIRVTEASVAPAWDLPEHTFGAAYANFMGQRGFSPDDRPPVRYVDDAELAYVAARAREVHDFWHVLFGMNTSVLGETALKVMEFSHLGLPVAGLATLGGLARLDNERRRQLIDVYIPWGWRAGLRSAPLMCLKYEDHFEEDLMDLRARWRIMVAPPLPEGKENKV